ncbi:MAG: M48 family metallopeptidase [Proteobacteria bacterium]|nr:M48 family metallopeptidase [Pseudomonadota bacterium]HQR04935.1 M48 family metallopeptidase [Rhodocyclaceae bacterium]
MPATAFTLIFLAALIVTTLLRGWLARRQMIHVGANRDTVPARFADRISLADHQKAADYTLAKTRIGIADLMIGAASALILTLGGLLQRCADLISPAFPADSPAFGVALFGLLILIGFVIDLPLGLYRTFVLETRFGFNKTTPRLYVMDNLKQMALTIVIGGPLAWGVLWLMGRMGDTWWLWVWACWLGFNLLALVLYPTLIAPLFNTFKPLEQGDVKARIERLLTRCAVTRADILMMDGSRRSAHGNAYFTGFGTSRRIVFFDTLLAHLAPPEVEAVLAHEIGHYRCHHLWKRLGMLSVISLGLLWILSRLMDQTWFYSGLGVHTQGTAMALLLFSIALPLFTFPFAPLLSALSRRHEYEADAYAARQSGAADLVSALVKLYRDNASTLTPDPLHSLFHDSHPPASLRIARLADR